jgi:hypothetical protein
VRTQIVTAPVAATAAAKPPANNIATAATAIPWQDPPDAARAATPAEAEPAPVAQTPASKAADGAASATAAGLPACLPTALQNVLSALETRFPRVKVVSTTHLHTDNHSHGSVREKLHLACKAIDIKIPGDAHQITAFLHARPEVGGVNAYRNHVVHFDLSAKYAKTGDRVAAAGSRAGH